MASGAPGPASVRPRRAIGATLYYRGKIQCTRQCNVTQRPLYLLTDMLDRFVGCFDRKRLARHLARNALPIDGE
jgi:hypothetical protein